MRIDRDACAKWLVVSAVLAAGVTSPGSPVSAAGNCTALADLTIPTVTIVSAESVAEGTFTPPGAARPLPVKAFCRVAALAAPTPDSHIAIEIWLPPSTAWNRKLLGTANGGFSGAIGYAAMAAAVARGYAAAGTDTGHTGDQMDFGRGHPEKIVDWAYRSIHVMTDLAKLVVRDYQGQFPTRSYFEGCSTGGQQALSEAQRFPHDYDGIVAGDPGHNRIRLILGFLWSWEATHGDDGKPLLTSADLSFVTTAAVAACDADDGLKDGLLSNPRACRFDPASLVCRDGATGKCLTERQAAAVKKVYDGAKNKRTGDQIFPGWIRGSEQGWGTYLVNPAEPMRLGLFRDFAFHDPHWDWRTFDWDRDVAFLDESVPFLDATSTDLGGFKTAGGKMIMYTGLADPVVPPADTFNYYEAVARAMGGMPATQRFFRFFPVPGMGHCMGGPGPATFDALGALDAWVERGIAPDAMPASHSTGGAVDRSRPLCAYPKSARYKGTGSMDDAASFTCAEGR